MNVIIRELRERGAKRADRAIQSDQGVAGVLTLSIVASYYELKVFGRDDMSFRVPLVPSLFDAKCVSLEGRGMIWRGYQRVGRPDDKAAPTYLQEWAVHVEDRV